MTLTSVVIKSWKDWFWLIWRPALDPLQFAYRVNRSVDDAVNMGLHFILQHLGLMWGTCLWPSAPLLTPSSQTSFRINWHSSPSPPPSVSGSPVSWQTVSRWWGWKNSSNTRTISTGDLSPLLFSLYTNGCAFKDPSVKLLKFADDTTLIGIIQDGDESAYRQEVKELAVWCSLNNLELNPLKTVEMIVDFKRTPPPPLSPSWRALWLQRSHSDSWAPHFLRTWSGTIRLSPLWKKAQQRLYFLHQLRKFNLPKELLIQFYSAIIESVLCTSITVCFSSATKSDLRRL